MSLRSKIASCETIEDVLRIDSMVGETWKEEHPDVPLSEVSLDQIKSFALDLIE